MFLLLYLIFIISSFPINCFKIGGNSEATGTECRFNINDNNLPANTPLLLKLGTNEILYPECGAPFITLNIGDVIELACPGSGFIEIGGTSTNQQLIKATCSTKRNFKLGASTVDVDIMSVQCSRRITSEAKYTEATCSDISNRNGKEIEVGLQINDGTLNGRWIQLMTTCFDATWQNVLYSRYTLTKLIGAAVTGGTSPSWSEDNFYNLGTKVDDIYPKEKQRVTINRQVGLTDGDITYVKASGNYYIAKGHLAARTDFLFNAQQMQTFHYINSAPQWQIFNAGNWFYLERDIRNFAYNNFIDLEVYTGTYGISTLPHATTHKDIELYLFVDANGNKAVPMPELFWKIVRDSESGNAIAFLGVNNPYHTDVSKSIICKDIADEVTWLTFDRLNTEAGFIYACNIADFARFIPSLPQFDVKGILN